MKLGLEIFVLASSFFVIVGIPFFYVLRTDNIKKGVMLTWALPVLYFVIMSIPVYEIVLRIDEESVVVLPEGNSIVASIFIGWLWGLIVSCFASLIRKVIKHFWPFLLPDIKTNNK